MKMGLRAVDRKILADLAVRDPAAFTMLAEKARAAYEELSDKVHVGQLTNNLGGLNFLLGKTDEAIVLLKEAFGIALETGRSFGVGAFERLYRITLPSAVPYIATGLRISSTVSLILAFTAELFMGTPGLGQAVNYAESYGLTDQLYALALATGFLGIAIHLVTSAVERRALRWHPSQRTAAA